MKAINQPHVDIELELEARRIVGWVACFADLTPADERKLARQLLRAYRVLSKPVVKLKAARRLLR